MFVYHKDNQLRITFDDNKPVVNPAINIDVENKQLFVNGAIIDPVTADVVTTDVVYPTAEVVNTAKTVVLKGSKISVPEDTAGDGVYHVTKGGYLTIEGDGVIDGVGNNDYNMAIWADEGHVVINGGTFTNSGATATNDPAHFDLLYVKNGGIIEINGGTFICETPKWTLNSHDSKPGKFIVRGGSFVGFDPSCATTEPGDVVSWVAEGYRVIREGNVYTVTKI